MGVHNLHFELRQLIAMSPLVKAATATLTVKELLQNFRINAEHASTQINLTLPAASKATDGCVNIITDTNAAVVTVVCTEGFGAGNVTVTLAQGEFVVIFSDEDDWYILHNEPSA